MFPYPARHSCLDIFFFFLLTSYSLLFTLLIPVLARVPPKTNSFSSGSAVFSDLFYDLPVISRIHLDELRQGLFPDCPGIRLATELSVYWA